MVMISVKKVKQWIIKKIYIIVSFLLPSLIMGSVFVVMKIHPFGDRQIIITDFYNQYYPFINELQNKLKNGGSLLYTWNIGLGTNFWALSAYYTVSPFNFLAALFPQGMLRDIVTFFVIVRFGLAGMFFSIYLKNVFKRLDYSIPVFSLLYALCGFIIGYYWNIIWIDSFMLFPLVMLGLYSLVREGKFKLYTIALALCIILNYYMGFMICLFTFFYFFVLCINEKPQKEIFLRRLLQIAVFSLIAILITCVVTLPAYVSLQSSSGAGDSIGRIRLYNSFLDIFGQLISFNKPTTKDGLPNLFTSIITVVLVTVYFGLNRQFRRRKLAKASLDELSALPSLLRVPLRTKLANLSLLIFLAVSTNVSLLDYIWHGFHYTNMIPHRFVFSFSFFLITLAYTVWCRIDDIDLPVFVFAGIIVTAIHIISFKTLSAKTIIPSLFLAIVYIMILYAYVKLRRRLKSEESVKPRNNRKSKKSAAGGINQTYVAKQKKLTFVLQIVLLLIVCAEMYINALTGIKAGGTSEYNSYLGDESVISLIDELKSGGENFYRIETTKAISYNDPALFSYKGISQFSSTCNVNVTKYLRILGLAAWEIANRYMYFNSTPFLNSMLDLKYIIARDGSNSDMVNLERISSEDDFEAKAFENKYYLPLGFMVDSAVLDIDVDALDSDSRTPFEAQNTVFNIMTGVDGEVFESIDMCYVSHKNLDVVRYDRGNYRYKIIDDSDSVRYLRYNYEAHKSGMYYAYTKIPDANYVLANNIWHKTGNWHYSFPVGNFKNNDIFSIHSNIPEYKYGTALVHVTYFNQDIFDEGFKELKDEPFVVGEYTDTMIKGTVDVKKEGALYTSIPYEKGWRAWVDGNEVEVQNIANALIALPLSAGEHEIVLKYLPEGFIAGIALTILGIASFILICIFSNKKTPV